MPCDEKRTISLDLPNLNAALMDEVLEELGFAIQYKNGKLVSLRKITEERIQQIKTTYAKKAVKQIARKHGWSVNETQEDTIELER